MREMKYAGKTNVALRVGEEGLFKNKKLGTNKFRQNSWVREPVTKKRKLRRCVNTAVEQEIK